MSRRQSSGLYLIVAALLSLVAPRSEAQAPGDVDPLDLGIPNGSFIGAIATQADGKTIIGGNFNFVLGVRRNNIARLNADGTLDMGFDPNVDGGVYCVAVQPDGKVLIGGSFLVASPNGAAFATPRARIARLNADGSLDPGFDPQADDNVAALAVQADGKVLLGGSFRSLGVYPARIVRHGIARVLADGTLDTTFDPNPNSEVQSLAVQPDGKILLGGDFSSFAPNGMPGVITRQHLARINVDGTLDPDFDPAPDGLVLAVAMQADGKILLGGTFTALQPNHAAEATARQYIARINADGTLDPDFDPKLDDGLQTLAIQADGRVLLGGLFTTVQPNGASIETTRQGMARVSGDGTLDAGFDPSPGSVHALGLQADGKVMLGGGFTALQPNGAPSIARFQFARLFNDPATQSISVPDATRVRWERGGSAPEVSRATFELSMDGGSTWGFLGNGVREGATPNWQITGLSLPANGQIRARGVTISGLRNGSSGFIETMAGYHVPTAGEPDPLDPAPGGGSFVFATAVQPDGKVIIAGEFDSVLGVPRRNIARLNVDGTLDMGFDPSPDQMIYAVVVQPDGKILMGGIFTSLQPNGASGSVARDRIARVNADGTLDTGFSPALYNAVEGLALQPDGKILVVGGFTLLRPTGSPDVIARNRIARLNSDGTLDTAFDPGANDLVFNVSVQGDGKILLAGAFTTFRPHGQTAAVPRGFLVRVNADGTLDASFDPKPDNQVYAVASQPDGKILLGGSFASLQPNGAVAPTGRMKIARVNADGTLDMAFDPSANAEVWSLAVQADGKVVLGGLLTTLRPNGAAVATARIGIGRVNSDGTLDTGFDPRANSPVYSVALQADGRILLGGSFTTLQPDGASVPTSRRLFARLVNDPATQTLSVLDATRVTWTRGGSSPELVRATFELSIDGGATWTPLGQGVRIGATPNWELTSLSLPASGHVRARGVATGGFLSSTSGLIESVVSFSGLAVPDIAVTGNGVNITDGDTTPSLADHTHFGSSVTTSTIVRTFTVTNNGAANLALSLGSITVGGANAADFTIGGIALPATILPASSVTFTLTFHPSAVGLRSSTLAIASNDADETSFDFSIRGEGLASCSAISLASLPNGIVGEGYTGAVTAAGGTAPYTYAVTSGALPTSLLLALSGVGAGEVTGTPSATGTFAARITATDALACTGVSDDRVVIGSSIAAGDLDIREFRSRGPAGAEDEYIEIANRTASSLTIAATDGSEGFGIAGSSVGGCPTGATTLLAAIPNGTVIPVGGSFLAANDTPTTGYSLGSYGGVNAATPDVAWLSDLCDGSGIGLFRSATMFDTLTRLDAVGFAGSPALYREGAGLGPAAGIGASSQWAYVRRTSYPTAALKDTTDNGEDFQLVSIDAGLYATTQSALGSPGPQNLASARGANLLVGLADPGADANAAPNRIQSGNSHYFRRKITNNTDSAITRVKLRIVDLATLYGLGYNPAAQADGRGITTSDVVITLTDATTMHVKGLTLEAPAVPFSLTGKGAGYNASFVLDLTDIGGTLAKGASIHVNLGFRSVKGGPFYFLLIPEILN